MQSRQITVHGQPVGKARARAGNGHHYTPTKTVMAEKLVALAYRARYIGTGLIDTPITLSCNWFFEMPKSWSKKKKSEMDGQPHTSPPDLDNLQKLVCDALNGIAWTDDRLVWANGRQTNTWVYDSPRTEILIEWEE